MLNVENICKYKQKLGFVANSAGSMWNFRLELLEFLKSKGCSFVIAVPKDSFF